MFCIFVQNIFSMKRFFTEYLLEWKNRTSRKPLIVRGARQVGKTYTIETFGKENFGNYLKFNFEENPELKNVFITNDVEEIVRNLEIISGSKIIENETLIFLDEIQICPEAIVSLRYFYEKKPNLHIISAGSLLDHTLNKMEYSMPVGRVEFAYMYPMNFYEFLMALKENSIVEFLRNYTIDQTINQTIHQKILKLLRQYFFVGGMPEAVYIYSQTNSLIDIERIHESKIKSFEYDFSKYGKSSQYEILTRLLYYTPKSVGKKFKYVNFDNNIRSNVIKDCISLLEKSRVIHSIKHSKSNSIPLEHESNDKVFKLLFLDIGLLNHILKIRLEFIENLVTAHEGLLAEQFIGQEMIAQKPYYLENNLHYWTRERRNSEAEVDYVAQVNQKIIPIEVKSGKKGTLKSLQVYSIEKKSEIGLRFNSNLPQISDIDTNVRINKDVKKVNFKLISLPLYLVGDYNKIIEHFLNKKEKQKKN